MHLASFLEMEYLLPKDNMQIWHVRNTNHMTRNTGNKGCSIFCYSVCLLGGGGGGGGLRKSYIPKG